MNSSDIYTYCENHSGIESIALKNINRDTHANVLKPRMLSGHLQGRVLSMLSHILAPTNILEIGTFTGYSAVCLAEGLTSQGTLTTIEANEEYEEIIKKNIADAGLNDKIELILGNALDVIPNLTKTFDLVFIDADKLNYSKYYQLALEKTRIGGIIISDNVLWDNKVLNSAINDKTTKHLREFNQELHLDSRTEKVLLPIRDGLFVSRKIK
jgi:caffeoyl-CoA O-methyltransferase